MVFFLNKFTYSNLITLQKRNHLINESFLYGEVHFFRQVFNEHFQLIEFVILLINSLKRK